MLLSTLGSLGSLGTKPGVKQDQYYQKAKEFTLCLEEVTKNFDKQNASLAANVTAGKQLAQSFTAYKKVAAFHQPIFPIVEFLQKSTLWLFSTEDLALKLVASLTDKMSTPTKESLKNQATNLKAIKQKKRSLTDRPGQPPRKVDEKKGSEQCAYDVEEITINSLCYFWEAYFEYFEEGHRLMSKVKEGVVYMKKMAADAAKTKKPGSKKIFGVSLEELADRESPSFLPPVLESMLNHISKLVTLEGIFRVSASKTTIDALRDSVDAGTLPDFSAIPDPHTVPSLFKSFLRMLPVPLIPYSIFQAIPNLNPSIMSNETIIGHLKTLVQSLSPSHYHLLGRLLSLCHKINTEKATTKMNASNIAVVIGPNIIRTPEGPNSPDSFGDSNTIVQLLVEHYENIYPEAVRVAFYERNTAPPMARHVVDSDDAPSARITSMRKLRAHGVTIDRHTISSLNWEADINALSHEPPLSPRVAPPLQTSQSLLTLSAHSPNSARRPSLDGANASSHTSDEDDDSIDSSGTSTDPSSTSLSSSPVVGKDTATPVTPSKLPNRVSPPPVAAHADNTHPLSHSGGIPITSSNDAASRSVHKSVSVGHIPAAVNPSPAVVNPSPVVVNPSPAAANPPVAANSSPATANPSPAAANPFSTPHVTPPVVPARSNGMVRSSTNPPKSNMIGLHHKTPSGPSPPATPAPAPPSPVSTPISPPASKVKIIGKAPPKLKLGPPPIPPKPSSPHSPSSPSTSSLALSMSPPASAPSPAFRTARPTQRPTTSAHAHDATIESSLDGVKGGIARVLGGVVENQLGTLCGKLGEVKTIPDGVPFIHVLKAVTPELDKLKRIMPIPPHFEKLPDLPPNHDKFTRLKFTLEFALKDLTRVLEKVGIFASGHESSADIPILLEVLGILYELQRVLDANISKL